MTLTETALAYFDLGDLSLDCGEVLKDARIAYRIHGRPNADASNIILYPTWFMGTDTLNEWLIGTDKALNPDAYCIVIPNMLGNGLSTSPSNAQGEQSGAGFPHLTVRDQVRAQKALLDHLFNITRIYAVVGWSMGACQTYQWAVSYPDLVERIMPFCGSACTTEHNHVFLDGVAASIAADGTFADGHYDTQPRRGLLAAAAVYAGWGFSQAFYRSQLYQEMGFDSYTDFVAGFWEPMFTENRDANDIMSMIGTWKSNDVGQTQGFDGDLIKALGSIRARTLVMAAERDLYFTVEDEEWEAAQIPDAEFKVIPGLWGHSAGAGINDADTAFIDTALKGLLALPAPDLGAGQ